MPPQRTWGVGTQALFSLAVGVVCGILSGILVIEWETVR